jgi:hypothetical protein
MKSASIYFSAIGLLFIFLLSLPVPGQSQESEIAPAFTSEQLAQMLAPIALYPDAFLAQVLMASTYPIEVVESDRWVQRNPNLKGERLDEALLAEDWDPSVKALCHFPTVLALMSERIGETTSIGNAFLAQEKEVMDTIQHLRSKAYEQGNLKSSNEQKIIVQKQTIIIQPADPRVIYVPYYDPLYVYGPWWYPAYPPYYWGPRRASIAVGISYWPGFYVSFAFGTWSHFDWHHHYVFIDVYKRPRFVRQDRWIVESGRWLHVPRHRRGVAYRDKLTARKYGQYPQGSRSFDRDSRGFSESLDRSRQGETRTRIGHSRQERERIERELRAREQADRQTRQRAEQAEQNQQRAEQSEQTQQRIEQERQTRQRPEQMRQVQERGDRNVFNLVDEGRREHVSSERGRNSREGHDSGKRSRSNVGRRDNRGSDDEGDRDGRGRWDGGGRDDRGRRR